MSRSDLLRTGCSVTNHLELQGLTAEEIYDKLLELQKLREAEKERAEGEAAQPEAGDNPQPTEAAVSQQDASTAASPDMPDDAQEKPQDATEANTGDENGNREASSDEKDSKGTAESDPVAPLVENQDENTAGTDSNEELNQPENIASGNNSVPEIPLDDDDPDDIFDDLDLSADEQDELAKALQQAVDDAFDTLSDEEKQMMRQVTRTPFHEPQVGGNGSGSSTVIEKPEPAEMTLLYSLRKYFRGQRAVDKGRTYRRPNKKYESSGIIVKSRANVYKEQKTLACYVDISGSMSEPMIQKALGILKSVESMKRMAVVVHYFNNGISDEFRPGGGTQYEEIFRHAKSTTHIKGSKKPVYDCLAIITDDSTSRIRDKYEFESIWLVGVDGSPRDDGSYSISKQINTKKGNVTARHFAVNVVGQ